MWLFINKSSPFLISITFTITTKPTTIHIIHIYSCTLYMKPLDFATFIFAGYHFTIRFLTVKTVCVAIRFLIFFFFFDYCLIVIFRNTWFIISFLVYFSWFNWLHYYRFSWRFLLHFWVFIQFSYFFVNFNQRKIWNFLNL